mgnify:CR=1 FL=1
MGRFFNINYISIHALREEGDADIVQMRSKDILFLSTPSARRATHCAEFYADHLMISIHALREEGDPAGQSSGGSRMDFYPRPPRGGRPERFRDFYESNG